MPNVPIVTSVTKAQLDALVAANGLNEGLQYKVTDKGWLLLATSDSAYKFASVPYKSFVALITQVAEDAPTLNILHNEIGEIIATRVDVGVYNFNCNGAFQLNKTVVLLGVGDNAVGIGAIVAETDATALPDNILMTVKKASTMIETDSALYQTYFEIRVYL